MPAVSAILDRFLHHPQTIAITGRGYRLKDQTSAKEQKPLKQPRITSNDFGDHWRAYLRGRGESVTRCDRRQRELEFGSPLPPLARPRK